MEKAFIVVGDVLHEHYRTLRNRIVQNADDVRCHRITIDDLMVNDLELEVMHGNGVDLLKFKKKEDEYHLALAFKHLKVYGDNIAIIVFDERSLQYRSGSVDKALQRLAPRTQFWLSGKDGSLQLTA